MPNKSSKLEFSQDYGLTPREREIVEYVLCGRKSKTIADNLGIAHRTVENHISSIFSKMGVSSRFDLTAKFSKEHVNE